MSRIKNAAPDKLGLHIVKGGRLMRETQNVTKFASRFLFSTCFLDEGVTLKDIFILLDSDLETFDRVFGNWCKELVLEGLEQASKPSGEIEALELYWNAVPNKPSPSRFYIPEFRGLLAISEGDTERCPCALDFTSPQDIINCPVILNCKISVRDADEQSPTYYHELYKLDGAEYTLAQILYGIIWELSFHGSPKDRDRTGSRFK